MPRISVVVPVYNVEGFVGDCLRSVAGQTLRDLEIVVVDDGSTDGGPERVAAFAAGEPRMRVITQANGGLGHARNVGLAAGDSDLVAFVDSDDVLPPDALERLTGSLDRTASDLATGRVQRLEPSGATHTAPFLRKTHARTRRATHVTRFRWLVSDRVAWNKLWRRDFLARHDLRFAEGVFHEDIPMVVPAHFLARTVDVVAHPVYRWRMRDGGERSITQHRLEERLLRDRVEAVRRVCDFLDERFPAEPARRWYHESVLAEDLGYHLDVLDAADEGYRRLFLDEAGALLDRFGPGAENGLPAIQRLKWHLVRRGLLDELLEVLSFERSGGRGRTRWIGPRRYGDYPFLGDDRLAIPRAVYRTDELRRRARHAATLLRL